MSTHSTIGYELPDNGYAGVYAHYDGYPSSIVPALIKLGHDGVMMAVERALLEGGFRTFGGGRIETFVEAKGQVEATSRSGSVRAYSGLSGLAVVRRTTTSSASTARWNV